MTTEEDMKRAEEFGKLYKEEMQRKAEKENLEEKTLQSVIEIEKILSRIEEKIDSIIEKLEK